MSLAGSFRVPKGPHMPVLECVRKLKNPEGTHKETGRKNAKPSVSVPQGHQQGAPGELQLSHVRTRQSVPSGFLGTVPESAWISAWHAYVRFPVWLYGRRKNTVEFLDVVTTSGRRFAVVPPGKRRRARGCLVTPTRRWVRRSSPPMYTAVCKHGRPCLSREHRVQEQKFVRVRKCSTCWTQTRHAVF